MSAFASARPAFAAAAERNKEPIAQVLIPLVPADGRLLEVGSGTGQHAVHLAGRAPGLRWQPSELAASLASLAARIAAEAPPNVAPPLELDVSVAGHWPAGPFDVVFSANTAHIMGWPAVVAMLEGAARVLSDGGLLALYGPFRFAGRPTAPSNEEFDAMLRARDPASGLRQAEQLDEVARGVGLGAFEARAMPANNDILTWRLRR